MRYRDPRKKKARDLRRIARSGGYNPSIFVLFHKYHPEVKEQEKQLKEECRAQNMWWWLSAEWSILHNLEFGPQKLLVIGMLSVVPRPHGTVACTTALIVLVRRLHFVNLSKTMIWKTSIFLDNVEIFVGFGISLCL